MVTKRKLTGVVDASSLLSSTSGRRRVQEINHAIWKCEYCQAEMKHEMAFMKHKCTQMDRAQEIKTVEGQAAYQYYCDWFKTLKRKAPPIDTFIHSRNYNAFRKLVDFFKRINLASSATYIRFMADNDISPVLWCRDQSYALYLTFLDNLQDPKDAATDTIQFLKKEARGADLTANEFLSAMTLKDIAVLTQRRLLSPYFLIFSSEFRKILESSTDEERNLFVRQVPLQFWASKLMNDNDLTDKIRTIVKMENI